MWAGWSAGFIGSVLTVLVKLFQCAQFSSHAVSGQVETMRIVNQAVVNGVSQCWIADGFMPLVDWQLTCHNGCTSALPVLKNFEKIAVVGCGDYRQPPVIKDQQISELDRF
ncbi:hypothetical protein RAZWK3B_00350 [Roseobacter sp. AzwK-3b]|nr:hypothetical protein RAZWK3B_00350 [Roseobacter sp. AzwK-3b]